MISLKQLTLARGAKVLLDQVDASVHAGQRVGIVGKNGTGKTSLFALLRGELHADAGAVDLPPRWVIASVEQETSALDRAAIDYVLDGDARLRATETAIADAEQANDGDALAHAHATYTEIDGYAARARAARIMHGLGFANELLTYPVATFSGGWRVRLNLARALACHSDLLLLDEPTNHLDLEAVIWLEEWLRSYPGTLMVISHDRDFLDNIAQQIWHFEDQQIRRYSGNFSAFEEQRAAQLALRQAMYDKQQREIAHLRSFVERFRAKATKARAAQSRLKALARMELITAAHVDSPFEFHFREPERSSRTLVKLEDVTVGYGAAPVLRDLNLSIESGMRIGVLGPNGAGKSTFMKLLTGILSPESGEKLEGKGISIGYFAQHQLEQLRADESALKHMQRLDMSADGRMQRPGVAARDQDLRDYLGGFNFRGDMADAPVGPFSGGEKARLALALIIWQRPNLLLLDEPTNHLDLDMRHALAVALQEYEGALVLVSHDRHLLRTATDQFLLVADSAARWFDGDLDDYRDWLQQQRAAEDARETAAQPVAESRRDVKRREAEARQKLAQRRKPLETELKQLEKRIEELAHEKADIDHTLADQGIYANERREQLKALMQRQARAAEQLGAAEERWLGLQTELEQIAASAES